MKACDSATVFQFHLVRLKVHGAYPHNPSFVIFQFHLVRLKEKKKMKRTIAKKFQFHLVRLKEGRTKRQNGKNHISIPFSTIKSKIQKMTGQQKLHFNSI